MSRNSGHLVLVVGPSGAGKDSILRGAQAALRQERDIVFPRRFVTRFADAAAEDHYTMTEMEFATGVAKDAFSIWWRAHGNSYGIGKSIESDLSAGCVVAVNCSRTALAEVAERFVNVMVVEITAPPHVLVERIVARGRESEEQANQRVAREVPLLPAGLRTVRIMNDGPLSDSVDRFCAVLRSLKNAGANPGGGALDGQHQNEDGDDDRRRLVIVE